MAHIEDRWQDKSKERTERHGKGKRWRVRYADPSGRERSRSFHKKIDADTFLTNVQADLLRGTYIDPHAGRVPLREYAEGWLKAQNFSQGTRERVEIRLRVHLYPVLGDKTLSQLAQRPSLVQAWLAGLSLAPSSQRSVLVHLSSIMETAVGDGLVIRNPCKVNTVKAPRLDKTKVVPWEISQVSAVREALPPYLRALCDAGAGLGLRQGEAFGLSPDDIGWLRESVHVCRQVVIVGNRPCFAPPKFGKERDIPLPPSVHERLSAHLAEFPAVSVTLPWKKPDGKPVTARLIFTSMHGHAISRHWFNRSPWADALKAAGIRRERHNGFHALRHHFASLCLREGTDIKELAEHLGHGDAGFTLRVYTHLMKKGSGRMSAAIDKALNSESKGPETAQEAK